MAENDLPFVENTVFRTIRIAELDPVPALDALIKDLEGIPGLIVDRYLIPKFAYGVFAAHPPPIGLDFPIATLETSEDSQRVYGLVEVTALLQELAISAFAVTRKMKKTRV